MIQTSRRTLLKTAAQHVFDKETGKCVACGLPRIFVEDGPSERNKGRMTCDNMP